jgi:hypothetical protein
LVLTSFVIGVRDGVLLHDFGGHQFDLVLRGWEGLGHLGDGGQGVHNRNVAQPLGNGKGSLSVLKAEYLHVQMTEQHKVQTASIKLHK